MKIDDLISDVILFISLVYIYILLNVINKNIPIDEKTIKCLNKHKNVLRRLTKAKLSTNSRKKLLRQKGGGFLATILPIALSALTSLLVKK